MATHRHPLTLAWLTLHQPRRQLQGVGHLHIEECTTQDLQEGLLWITGVGLHHLIIVDHHLITTQEDLQITEDHPTITEVHLIIGVHLTTEVPLTIEVLLIIEVLQTTGVLQITEDPHQTITALSLMMDIGAEILVLPIEGVELHQEVGEVVPHLIEVLLTTGHHVLGAEGGVVGADIRLCCYGCWHCDLLQEFKLNF